MKYLAFLLFPILLFAQNPYPDTLYLTDGRSFPCLITGINNSRVAMIYSNERTESIVLQAVNRISLEQYGNVYKSGIGFTTDIDIINEYIGQRLKKLKDEETVRKGLEKLTEDSRIRREDEVDFSEELKFMSNKKWSFGVLYVPYYSSRIYVITQGSSSNPPAVYNYATNETNMEGQISYGLDPIMRLTLDLGYTSTYTESRDESHSRSDTYSYDSGSLDKTGLNAFDITFGIRYYLIDIFAGNVTVYALAGVGKQFASATDSYKNLFPTQSQSYSEDNAEEYLSDLNSPWHFNLGFGAEYFFNESLSLTSNIRVLYTSSSGKYDYRYISDYETRTEKSERTYTDIITRIGLGLNFYF